MAFSCSLQPKYLFSSSASASLKPRLLALKKCNINVFSNFINRSANLATQTAPGSSLAAKCLTNESADQQVFVVDGFEPAVITPPQDLKRSDFALDFKFGASTSALQTEGSGTEGGRGPSTWDFMIEAYKGKKAVDSYHMYKEDVKLLKNTGLDSYRFSIAWPRILPKGTEEDGGINQEGIDFYNNLINELIANGITPIVTLFHFDIPVSLQNKYHGFLGTQIIEDFTKFADICYKNFGDRVKFWSTINEPYVFGSFGYKIGLPADVQSDPLGPYIATHNIILAHATAAQLYHDKYQTTQKGKIGISLPCKWYEPQTIDPRDVDAAHKHLDFMLGWYMDPFVNGDYPTAMRDLVKGLPEFTKEERKMIKSACDYIGVNYYTARFVKQNCTVDGQKGSITIEYLESKVDKDGNLIGQQAQGQDDIYIYPDGLRKVLLYIKEKYNNPPVYITENGMPTKPSITGSVGDLVQQGNTTELRSAFYDDYRINHIEEHLLAVREAIRGGANVKGYIMWSLMDNMEIGAGYDVRFGLNYVDYFDNLKRYPKKSSVWLANFLKETPNPTPKLPGNQGQGQGKGQGQAHGQGHGVRN